MSKYIYVIEDDIWYSQIVKHIFTSAGYEVKIFNTANEFLSEVSKINPQIITLDLSLPDMNSRELLSIIRVKYPKSPVIVISGQQDTKLNEEIIKQGVYDFIIKNEDIKFRLKISIKNIEYLIKLENQLSELKKLIQ